jgi:hypothetical protein
MRYIAACFAALLMASPAHANIITCIEDGVQKLDDKISSAEVVAKAIIQYCDDAIEETIRLTRPDVRGLQRTYVKEALKEGFEKRALVSVLRARNQRNSQAPKLGTRFNSTDYPAYKPWGTTPGRRFVNENGSMKTILTVSDLPTHTNLIIGIAQEQQHPTVTSCYQALEKTLKQGWHKVELTREEAAKRWSLDHVRYVAEINQPGTGAEGFIACTGRWNNDYVMHFRVGINEVMKKQYESDIVKSIDDIK